MFTCILPTRVHCLLTLFVYVTVGSMWKVIKKFYRIQAVRLLQNNNKIKTNKKIVYGSIRISYIRHFYLKRKKKWKTFFILILYNMGWAFPLSPIYVHALCNHTRNLYGNFYRYIDCGFMCNEQKNQFFLLSKSEKGLIIFVRG